MAKVRTANAISQRCMFRVGPKGSQKLLTIIILPQIHEFYPLGDKGWACFINCKLYILKLMINNDLEIRIEVKYRVNNKNRYKAGRKCSVFYSGKHSFHKSCQTRILEFQFKSPRRSSDLI
ncbi:uncharacterized protein H6S33_006106 [Morchella sextelata]|uniref:uncharacterized protein n=1 Tax=Morchella sextelata TaxID=1174677 RepID=UPI001D03FC76|nr:uncharacterized protein H6S33_006106 [Morchella sextelata]KAH0614220.1 hypothetical protein H6S33_006106 [Morchella sextelata]